MTSDDIHLYFTKLEKTVHPSLKKSNQINQDNILATTTGEHLKSDRPPHSLASPSTLSLNTKLQWFLNERLMKCVIWDHLD